MCRTKSLYTAMEIEYDFGNPLLHNLLLNKSLTKTIL